MTNQAVLPKPSDTSELTDELQTICLAVVHVCQQLHVLCNLCRFSVHSHNYVKTKTDAATMGSSSRIISEVT